jgi:pilus assembly protein Flp/PilA
LDVSDFYWRLNQWGHVARVNGGKQADRLDPSVVCLLKQEIKQMSKFMTRFVKDESGATAIEYGLIAALMAVAIIAAVGALSGPLKDSFTSIGGKLAVS